MLQLGQDELERIGETLALAELSDRRRVLKPAEDYIPHDQGQRQFHESRHAVRLLAPGNGWGKTTAMGVEAHAWATHTNWWQRTPSWPVAMLWFARTEDQFELIRVQLSTEVFGQDAKWAKADRRFIWGDGSFLQLALAGDAGAWHKWEGVNPDAIFFDEQPPLSLWREMQMRRRGKRDTRFVIGATATESDSWMETQIYIPWVEFHAHKGLDEDRAHQAQLHPDTFCWVRGGIDSNPGTTAEQRAWYHSRTWAHAKEKAVRLHGGFASWSGDCIFSDEGLALQAKNVRPGVLGWMRVRE